MEIRIKEIGNGYIVDGESFDEEYVVDLDHALEFAREKFTSRERK